MTNSVEVLGWTLIHFCWQAAVIALLYWVADLALPKARSNVRYVVSLAALLSMLAVSVVTLGYEEMRGATSHAAVREATPVTGMGEPMTAETLPLADYSGVAQLSGRAALLAELRGGMRPVMPWLVGIWLAGVLFLSTRTVGGWWMLQRLRCASMTRVPESVADNFARLARRIGVKGHIDLRICERISSPLAMGVVRSLVLLPASALTSLSPEQLEVVLAHELAHIRRADYLWNMLQTMIETLFFFHPAVWWVSRNLRQQRELCCDDVALECCADPMIYATALLCLEEQRGSRLHLAMALDGHRPGGLRARIGRMLGEAPASRGVGAGREIAPWSLVAVCAMLGLLLLPAHQVFAGLHSAEARSVDMHSQAEQMEPALASTVALPHAGKIAGNPSTDNLATDDQAVVVPAPRPAPKPVAPVVVVSAPARAPEPPVIALDSKVEVDPMYRPVVIATLASMSSPAMPQAAAPAPSSKADYIDQMRAAGYNVDLDKYVAMKIQGVTPEYARSMAATGFGKPTADDLIAMKIHGVDPGEVAELKSAGIDAGNYQDLITYRIFKVSPEFVAGMKAAGYSNIPAKKLVELRIHGVTPEFAKTTKQQFPGATLDELVQLRIFHIDDAFIASVKRHGLEPLTIEKLVRIRISGVLDDDNQKSEKTQ